MIIYIYTVYGQLADHHSVFSELKKIFKTTNQQHIGQFPQAHHQSESDHGQAMIAYIDGLEIAHLQTMEGPSCLQTDIDKFCVHWKIWCNCPHLVAFSK